MIDLLKEANATFSELIRMHELNQEMLETLQATMLWFKQYAEKNNIPLSHCSTYNSLINKAETLIEEISQEEPLIVTFKKLSDGSYHEPHNRHKVNRTEKIQQF